MGVSVMEQYYRRKSRPKILVADDDPSVLKAVAQRCKLMGFDVDTATSGRQVVIKASERRPDLIVVDVHMPEVDGLSAMSMLVEVAKKSRHLIVMTGRPSPEIAEYCKRLDAACVRKATSFWRDFENSLVEFYPERAAEIRQSGNPQARTPIKRRPRVLLIDDDVNVGTFYSYKFGKLGADLLYAADSSSGFWMAWRQEPNVIVADYCMPHGNAEHLLTRLRGSPETSSIPVVVHSGRRLSDAVKQRLQGNIRGCPGARHVLQKSPDVGELYDALQSVCGFASDLNGAPLYQ
jgi:CheY-like chemotaxis protein